MIKIKYYHYLLFNNEIYKLLHIVFFCHCYHLLYDYCKLFLQVVYICKNNTLKHGTNEQLYVSLYFHFYFQISHSVPKFMEVVEPSDNTINNPLNNGINNLMNSTFTYWWNVDKLESRLFVIKWWHCRNGAIPGLLLSVFL